jgi:alpha,alpha-trehalose phosphorylase
VHIASSGGAWSTVVFGFAGLNDHGYGVQFMPRLPAAWEGMSFRMQRHGAKMLVELDADGCTVNVLDGPPVPVITRTGADHQVEHVAPGSSLRIPSVELPS